MKRITRTQSTKYAFDWRDEPLLEVEPGEPFVVETWDASTGYFKSEADLAIPARRPGFDRVPPTANPIGGPVIVRGAERGDVLVVDSVEAVELEVPGGFLGGSGPSEREDRAVLEADVVWMLGESALSQVSHPLIEGADSGEQQSRRRLNGGVVR